MTGSNTSPELTVVNVGYRSTNYWVVSAGSSRLLVDLGWPGTMGRLQACLKRMDVPIEEIRFGLATHYHIDHAGLAQELKEAGVPLLVLHIQVKAIDGMKSWVKAQDQYSEINLHDNKTITFEESRRVLEGIGIPGEIVHTPGHSDDSISLLLNNGSVFTGDLSPPEYAVEKNRSVITDSWQRLRDKGASRVYPGHGPIRSLNPAGSPF